MVRLFKTPAGARIDWLEQEQPSEYTIISFRERLDEQFGWQCLCGNNSLMTKQERDHIENPASPKPREIADIVRNLAKPKVKQLTKGLLVDNFVLRTI